MEVMRSFLVLDVRFLVVRERKMINEAKQNVS